MISPINKRKTPGKFALFAVLGIFFSVNVIRIKISKIHESSWEI